MNHGQMVSEIPGVSGAMPVGADRHPGKAPGNGPVWFSIPYKRYPHDANIFPAVNFSGVFVPENAYLNISIDEAFSLPPG
ncbi:hypothetical protein JW777_03485 [bacterium]|nr:hypothetical protein [bacterium]